MLQQLKLEQAPPISVPFRFFTTAPLFGVAAALLVLFSGPALFASRWSPATLALTHLLTLGFMAFVMCGAMTQMLPVLGGAVVPRVREVSTVVHLSLVTGTLALTIGFLTASPALLLSAGALLVLGLGVFIAVLLAVPLRSISANRTTSAMRYALYALAITVALGLVLVLVLAGFNPGANPVLLTNVHLAWGLLGWIGLLVCGVAYQVVPMFQMTPRYPEWLSRRLVPSLFAGLIGWSVLVTIFATARPALPDLWSLVLVCGYSLFSIVTIRLQLQRRRRAEDITRDFWTLGMACALAASALWTVSLFVEQVRDAPYFWFLTGTLLIAGFAISVTNGMLYRIVPFLVWFHLQHRHLASGAFADVTVPNVRQIIPMKWMQWQFRAHFAALALLAAAPITSEILVYPAGTVLLASFLLLSYNLITAMLLFWRLNLRLSNDSPGSAA